jgi:putative transposase
VLSVRRQCDLLALSRSTLYSKPATESQENLALMRAIDEQYLKTPFYGRRKMSHHLERLGYGVNVKRVARLMRLMGLEALYPRPKTSVPSKEHRVYPYMLKHLAIVRPNQVWSADITYLPMKSGFLYLVAILDWFSRYVLSFRLSNTLDGLFCLETLDRALSNGRPEIFNTDQGAPFTARIFTERLETTGVAISMDSRAEPSTISLSSVSGVPSNTWTCTSTATKPCSKPKPG